MKDHLPCLGPTFKVKNADDLAAGILGRVSRADGLVKRIAEESHALLQVSQRSGVFLDLQENDGSPKFVMALKE